MAMVVPLDVQMQAHGLPDPVEEFPFDPVRKWRFDFAWPELKIALEVEGGTERYATDSLGQRHLVGGRHNRPRGYEADLEKYNAATLAGWRVLRATTAMVLDGRAVTLLIAALGV